MSEELETSGPEYPYNILPSDLIRRTLAHVPPAHSDEKLAEINAYRNEVWADEPIDPPPYPISITFNALFKKLVDDPYSPVDSLRAEEVRGALNWLIEAGHLEEIDQNEYKMTPGGLEALRA